MAKPKVKVLVEHSGMLICVYCDDLKGSLSDVLSVEGVRSAHIVMGFISVVIDPRYDIQEITDEIEALLKSEVPDVFKE